MTWTKLGLVWGPDGDVPWRRTHASLPLALKRDGAVHRVFCASRDERNRSSIGWVDVELDGTPVVMGVAERPALEPGETGAFDGDGVYPASIVAMEGRLLLYFVGWTAGSPPPLFSAAIGLAESDDGGTTFRRLFPTPILSRSEHDPCLVTSPCVRVEGGTWRMWYVSGVAWRREGDALRSVYDVKYAESDDGVAWRRDGRVCIELRDDETNIARPCVTVTDGAYRMWYSRNAGAGYRLGYAESPDGLTWERQDERVGIEPSPAGWDAESQAYPWYVEHGGRKWLLYNGNRFGRDGFGAAVGAT